MALNSAAWLFWSSVVAAAAPIDTRPVAATRAFAATGGERLWPGYGSAPFELLLVDGDREILLCEATERAGFTRSANDPATGCPTAWRARTGLPDNLLAAMPVLGLPSTIVVGTPERTGLTNAEWTRTLLHEHFHQWQLARPGYFEGVAALDLAGDDQTGMWMLNFAFPYDDPEVEERFQDSTRELAAALDARGTPELPAQARAYWRARTRLAEAAGARNWRYIDFQLWQEGVARWTEIALGMRHPNADVRSASADLERETLATLPTLKLANERRRVAYAFGAAETMLIEACDPHWRTRYVGHLVMTPLLDEAVTRCDAKVRG